MKILTARDNPLLKQLRRWAAQGRARRAAGVILLDGVHLAEALCAAGGTVRQIVVAESALQRPEISAWLATAPAAARTAAVRVPDALFAGLVPSETPTGLLVVATQPARTVQPAPDADSVLLDGVQDPGNLGTLLRTATAAGFRQILLGPGCADPWAPKTLRAGQGAQFLGDIHEGVDLPAFMATYRGTALVTRLDAATSLFATRLSAPVAWVFGAEGQGVSPAVAAAAHGGVRIPMPGGAESLNVAAAAAVCLFETVRQRTAGAG